MKRSLKGIFTLISQSNIIAGLAVAVLVILAVQLLWNNVLTVALPVAQPITFWQSAGLLILTSILFKNVHIKSNN